MRTKIVNGVEVIECVHCSGTGICRHSQERPLFKKDGIFGSVWDGNIKECASCGPGLPGEAKRFGGAKPTPPTCKICGGRGFYQS